jgi:hypothetical protein
VLEALRLLLGVAERRAGMLGGHARARAWHLALLAGFGLAAAVFLLVLATASLTEWLGLIPALAIMAGCCALGGAVTLLVMRAEGRAHAAAVARQRREEARALQTAALVAAPSLLRGGRLLAAAAGGLAVALIARREARRRPDRGRDPR